MHRVVKRDDARREESTPGVRVLCDTLLCSMAGGGHEAKCSTDLRLASHRERAGGYRRLGQTVYAEGEQLNSGEVRQHLRLAARRRNYRLSGIPVINDNNDNTSDKDVHRTSSRAWAGRPLR